MELIRSLTIVINIVLIIKWRGERGRKGGGRFHEQMGSGKIAEKRGNGKGEKEGALSLL